jgi:hypothetical protein
MACWRVDSQARSSSPSGRDTSFSIADFITVRQSFLQR